MTCFIRSAFGLAGLFALALAASAHAQSQPCQRSNDPTDFDNEVRQTACNAPTYEIPTYQPPEAPDPPRRTVTVTPHRQDYSRFPTNSLAQFYNSLTYEEKQRVVRIAAQHGVSDENDRPMSVEDFGALTDFLDSKMDHGGFSPDDKRQFLGQLAAEAHVRGNPTIGQDFGSDGGPRYDYSVSDTPR